MNTDADISALDDLSAAATRAVLRGWVLSTSPADMSTMLMRDHGYLVSPDTVSAGYALLDRGAEMRLHEVLSCFGSASRSQVGSLLCA